MDRATLLAAMDAIAAEKPRAITIPGLGEVHVRRITIGEIDEQNKDTADEKNVRGIARGACRLLCDESGNMLLNPDEPADVAKMAKLPLTILTSINKAVDWEGATEKK